MIETNVTEDSVIREQAKEAARNQAWHEPPDDAAELARLHAVIDDHIARLRDVIAYGLDPVRALNDLRDAAKPKPGRRLIHCAMGVCGADWDLDEVLREIDAAVEVRWADAGGHPLGVRMANGRVARFEVRRPV